VRFNHHGALRTPQDPFDSADIIERVTVNTIGGLSGGDDVDLFDPSPLIPAFEETIKCLKALNAQVCAPAIPSSHMRARTHARATHTHTTTHTHICHTYLPRQPGSVELPCRALRLCLHLRL